MRSFLRDLAGFLAIQALLLAALQVFYARVVQRDAYFAAWQDKHERLARLAPPRLILVGGSSLAFGVDSARLERATGYRVANLGLHAGLGAEFILREGESVARDGDLLLVTLEGPLLVPGDRGHPVTLLELLAISPQAWRYVPPSGIPAMLDDGLQALGKRPRALALWALGALPRGGVYAHSAFNAWGDAVAHLSLPSRAGEGKHGGLPPLDLAAQRRLIERLNLFAERVRARHARAAFALAPVPDDDRARQQRRVDGFVSLLRAELRMPLLDAPPSYPRSEFFDTAYHLTAEGRRRRTEALAAAFEHAGLVPPTPAGP